jgi:coniferyl-aldehyde dehydrogenase
MNAPELQMTPDLDVTFRRLQADSRAQVSVPRGEREARLDALIALVHGHVEDFVAAIAGDFGQRSAHETRLLEVFPALEGMRHARKHLGGWMKPQRRPVSMWFKPASAQLIPQPLGVVGIIVPWNYPLLLAVSPLAAALAAGNRVMLKMSEFTPRTGQLLAELVARYFSRGEVVVCNGDAGVGAAFAALPFDHLLFTGSTAVGHHIMQAASANLTPVTLELGGKSPVIVGPEYSLERAAERIMVGKLLNAGQTCIAPDYVLVPAGREEAFVAAAQAVTAKLYPNIVGNPDFSSIVNARHFDRLSGLLADAETQGARILPLATGDLEPTQRRLPPQAILGATGSMRIMQEEIFGPLLPVLPYRTLDEALAYINARPRPLALYVFEHDRQRLDQVLQGTIAGGVTVNDTILHIAQEELPFGGVGPSGMGQYHGYEGFRTFSKLKPVFLQSRLNGMALFNPPYGPLFERMVRLLIR